MSEEETNIEKDGWMSEEDEATMNNQGWHLMWFRH